MAVVVAKLEHGGLDLEAVAALHEPAPVGAAAELAVGHDLQAGLLLQPHHVKDGLVLDLGEGRRSQLALGVLAEAVTQCPGAQQTAHVIGPEGWPLGRPCCHDTSPRWPAVYTHIDSITL